MLSPRAREIGKTIKAARLDRGYTSRASLVETKRLKGVITQEGLRKIEDGERVPRLENLRRIAEVLGLGDKKIRELEERALEASVERIARRAGNASVTFQINGRPLKVAALPPKRKVEAFVRESVEEMVTLVNKYGVMPEDLEHFRRHARSILLSKLQK